MVEKVNALCNAIDTINSLPGHENNDKAVDELVSLLLAECKQMVEPPAKQAKPTRQFFAGKNIISGEPVMFDGDYVYPIAPARPFDKDLDLGLPRLP